MTRYIGLDLHKDYIHGCEWISHEGREKHFRLKNNRDAWANLAKMLGPDCEVAVEVTGNTFELYDALSPHCARMVLANPSALRRFGSGQHTDRVDAARLAKMMAMNAVPAVWVRPQEVREIRRLLQYRFKLVRHQVRCKNQVKAILRRYDCGSSRMNNAASVLQVRDHLNLDAADAAMLVSAAHLLASLETERGSIEAEIARRLAEHPEAKALLSIPGVGILTAAAMWAWIGEPGRFRTSKQVASYAGFDPPVHQSGQTYYHGKVSESGNRLLRTVLIEAAQVVARHDHGRLGQSYRRKSLHIGSRKAIVALARKLIVVAWKILLTGEPYRDEVVSKTRRKEIALRRMTQKESLCSREVSPAVRRGPDPSLRYGGQGMQALT
ncbi:MAG TPA: IS110 family transposase [Firmicutes bacterium]|nr:IS110 family transposase [Candidatus Fermentithermobacillaceae bacterium]